VKSLFHRIISAATAISLTLALTSCISINLPKDDASKETEKEKCESAVVEYDYDIVENDFMRLMNSYLNFMGDADFGGSSFLIATPDTALVDGDGAGLALSEDVALRNRDVENKLNVKISSKKIDSDSMYDAVYNACLSNDYFADIIMIPQYRVYQYAAAGILFNLNSLPFADFESGFNIESGVTAAMAGSTGWALGGWATLDEDSLPAVFFNKELIEKTGLADPYDLVESGEWTWDAFFEYTSALSGINAERTAEGLSDAYSFGSQNSADSLADAVYFSEGNRFILSGLGNVPAVAMDQDSSYHTMQTEQSLFNDPQRIQNPLEAVNVFADGGSMFLIDSLGTMKTISNSKAVWGVLPMPKKGTDQENYRSLVSPDGLMYAVPANTTGQEKVSRVMSAMNICSLGFFVDAYLKDCMYYYLRDNDSVASVEKVCYGAVWDMAYSAGGYDAAIPNATYFAVRNIYENNNDIQFYLDSYAFGANNALSRLFP